jgi:hypothetical protein
LLNLNSTKSYIFAGSIDIKFYLNILVDALVIYDGKIVNTMIFIPYVYWIKYTKF